jgi:tetratricopeptide (TPR) repeat protein
MTDGSHPVLTLHDISQVSTPPQLAQVLRQLRREQARRRKGAELTYRELSARTGWSVGLLAGYFGGQILPPTDRFDELMIQLDATPTQRGALASARDRVYEHRRRARLGHGALPVPRQLPPASFRLAGRARQLADLKQLLRTDVEAATGTIAVLSGTAGVGKTAIALHWAHRVAERFPDGQLFVNLHGFDPRRHPVNPAEVVHDMLDAFGVAATQRPTSLAAQVNLYRSILAGNRVLIVIDDARDADQVRPLLPGAPGCFTLVTSRNRLSGLVAAEGAHRVVVDLMPAGEARELLAHRVGQQRVETEPGAAAEVVERCARLPLALVVAAARASSHPEFALAAVADELRRGRGGLDAFAGEDPAMDARAAFACSYRYLGDRAATLFRHLGGHPGPDVTAPAAASLAGLPVADVMPALAELTRAHLLTEHPPGRYTAHDLLRTFAAELAVRHDTAAARRAALNRVLDHYVHTAFAAAMLVNPSRDRIMPGRPGDGVTPERLRDRDEAQRWFAREQRVLLNAVTHAAAEGLPTHAWQLAWALTDVLDWRGAWYELATVHGVARHAAVAAADPTGQIHADRGLARASLRLGRDHEARTHLRRAIDLCRATGDLAAEGGCHITLALVLERLGEHRRALSHSQRALVLFRAAEHPSGVATSLGVVGWYHALLGENRRALGCCRRALALQRRHGSELPSTVDSLGYVFRRLGRQREAAAAYARAVELYRAAGDRYHEADTLIHLGDAHHAVGSADRAVTAWRQAWAILDDLGHPASEDMRSRCRTEEAARDAPELEHVSPNFRKWEVTPLSMDV